MGWFSKGKSGGTMNVIRCDEPEYLVWKWRPAGQDANSTSRENSIRWGSSLRVKDGEIAAFVYKQKDGTMQDFIEGPFDEIIKTANFPVLSSIVGLAYGGDSPFQAEVYFINLAGIIQIKFAVPYFDVVDPRYADFAVPVAAGGSITFNIADYKAFIKLNRLINFDLEAFKKQIKDVVIRRVKGIITNFSIDRLVEFGMGMAVANQMVSTMNRAMQTMHVPGSGQTIPQPLQQIYFVAIDNKPVGPLNEGELSQLISQKKVKKDTLVWMPGMLGWQPVEKVSAILKIVALTPPELPK